MMGDNKKWRMNYSEWSEPDKGLEGIGEAIIHAILALVVLGAVYTFFAKTELDSAVGSSVIKTNAVESRVGEALDGLEEDHRDENGLRTYLKTRQ